MKKINDFVGKSGINKEFLTGLDSVYKILKSENFIYNKANQNRVNDVEGILSYLKSNSPIEDCGIQMSKDIVKKMREELGLDFFLPLDLFFNILKHNQTTLMQKSFCIDNEIKETIEFIENEQKGSKVFSWELEPKDIRTMTRKMNFFDKDIQEFINECAIHSYKGLQIKIDTVFEKRSTKKINYYEFKARPDFESVEELFLESKCIFIKNGLTHSVLWDIIQLQETNDCNLLLFYDECEKSVELGLKNSFPKNKKTNIYSFRMGKQFFIDEIYNVMSLIATLSNNVFVNGTGDEVKKYISFKNMFVYSKQSLKINIDKESPYIKSRIEILNKRIPISKEPQKIISKIQELEGKVFKANLNNEDIFKYKGIKEKVYSICHFFKALHECELCYSQELMIPKIYNFLEQRYNNTHSIGFYIMKQGFYNVLVNLFKDKGCNLSLILENAKKETDLGFKLNNELVNFFDQLNLVPIDYYIKSLIIVNSSLKDLSRTRYIIA